MAQPGGCYGSPIVGLFVYWEARLIEAGARLNRIEHRMSDRGVAAAAQIEAGETRFSESVEQRGKA